MTDALQIVVADTQIELANRATCAEGGQGFAEFVTGIREPIRSKSGQVELSQESLSKSISDRLRQFSSD
jgi:hypothetical protein